MSRDIFKPQTVVYEDKSPFSIALKRARKKESLTQAQVAESIDVSRTTYINWENGAGVPPLDKFVGLCHLLSIKPNAILGFS